MVPTAQVQKCHVSILKWSPCFSQYMFSGTEADVTLKGEYKCTLMIAKLKVCQRTMQFKELNVLDFFLWWYKLTFSQLTNFNLLFSFPENHLSASAFAGYKRSYERQVIHHIPISHWIRNINRNFITALLTHNWKPKVTW